MLQVLVESVKDRSEVILVLELELGELSIDPGGSGSHESVLARQLREDEVSKHANRVVLVLGSGSHVEVEESEGMHQGFLVPEVLGLVALHVLDNHLQVGGQVVRDLVFAGLLDVADGPDQVLVGSLDVPGVGEVNLHAHVLDWVLVPEVELLLGDEHKGKGQLKENGLDVGSAELSHLGVLDRACDESESRV